METIHKELTDNFVDCYGGPDGAMDDFSDFQKAVSYAMTSFFTTGGIRGGKKPVHQFHPRSFNLGFSKAVYEDTGGFPVTTMHPGEDMVFTIEVIKRGFETRLVHEAYVFHKRRISFKKFYKQVFGFGKTRYIISKHYPETFKIFFLFPSLFAIGTIGALVFRNSCSQNFCFSSSFVRFPGVCRCTHKDQIVCHCNKSACGKFCAAVRIWYWIYGCSLETQGTWER